MSARRSPTRQTQPIVPAAARSSWRSATRTAALLQRDWTIALVMLQGYAAAGGIRIERERGRAGDFARFVTHGRGARAGSEKADQAKGERRPCHFVTRAKRGPAFSHFARGGGIGLLPDGP